MEVREDHILLRSRSIRRDLQFHASVLANFIGAVSTLADDSSVGKDLKRERFDTMDAELSGANKDPGRASPAQLLRYTCEETGVPIEHAQHLLQAFAKRASGRAMSSWGELLTTCQFSAAPIARFLLDLHREDRKTHRPAEALYTARQVIFHLQKCGMDYQIHKRVLLPSDWLRQAGAHPEELGRRRTSQGLRIVMNRVLDRTGELLMAAEQLPKLIADPHLRRELAFVRAETDYLALQMRRYDPLRRRVALSMVAHLRCRLHARKRLRQAAEIKRQ